ncbi:transposase [Shimia sp. R11_0]|uniref:transposase n=1 Tax=Shimia sp. R11_0 TaxID=2821096 RepID=UPI001ADB3B67|nr:transposase [Shimia sp. R11_0]MBO9479717.1 transposase [Shimia sp. R11_0]
MFENLDADLRTLLDRQIVEPEIQIEHIIATDESLARAAGIQRSVPSVGSVASTILIAEMSELGQITCAQAAALTRLAHDSVAMGRKHAIGGGRRRLRHLIFQAVLVASHHNPALKTLADRLRDAGKPHKLVINAVARKLVTIVNALIKSGHKWSAKTL